jgi:hypothetical protein
MSDTSADTRALQRAFALHLRDPGHHPPPPGLDERRLRIYRDLFINNILSLLGNGFPVLRSLYGEDGWRALVRRWYANHRAQTPLFTRLGGEFVQWLSEQVQAGTVPDWQAELAHYEWMEIVAAQCPADLETAPAAIEGDQLDGIPVLSPLVWPLCYRWPVHRIRADARPGDTPPAQPTCLVIVRDRTDQVGFLEANPLTLRLLARLQERPEMTGKAHLEALAAEAGLEPTRLVEAGRDLFTRLRARDIVLGVRPG